MASRSSGLYRRRPNYEKKFYDYTNGFYPVAEVNAAVSPGMDTIPATPTYNALNLIPESNSVIGMNGRNCTIRSIYIRLKLYREGCQYSGVGASVPIVETNAKWRVLLVQDKQNNGQVINWTDVVKTTTWLPAGGTNEETTPESGLNMNYSHRFKILYDKVVTQSVNYQNDGTTNYEISPVSKYVTIYKKCNIKVDYAPMTTATRIQAEIRTNAIFLLLVSLDDNRIYNLVGPNIPSRNYGQLMCRFRFTDL